MYLNFCNHFLPSLGTLSNTREMGALLCSNSPGVLPSCRKGQSLSLFPTSPHCCACLLQPSSAGLSSSAHTCKWSNVTAFTFVLPARTHLPQTWHISTGSPCLLTTSAASLSFMSHLKSLTRTAPQPVLSPLYSLPVVFLSLPHPKGTSDGGPDYDLCKLQGQMVTWC